MIGLWDLSPPHGIVSLGGVFTKADCVWNEVADQAWLITTGSSPCQHRHYMCIIAIISLSKLGNKEALFNDLPQVIVIASLFISLAWHRKKQRDILLCPTSVYHTRWRSFNDERLAGKL